jgi:lauroyl/myristoyl acyltransferase
MSRLVFGWLTAIIAGMPVGLGYLLADALTEVHYRFFPARRHAALANLAVILPTATRRERARVVRGMMRSYNRMMFEFFRLPHLSREELIQSVEIVGREHLDAAIARGKGVVIASSHLGNWELAGVMVAQMGYTLHAVAGVQLGRWLSGAVRETKTEMALFTVSPEDGFRKLLRALEHNDCIALVVDGDIYNHGVEVDFFGRPYNFPAGPGVLAMRTGAQLICGYCERVRPGRFRVMIEPPRDPATFPSVAALNQAVAGDIARHIRDHVDQWCIFRPLFEPAATAAAEPAGEARRAEA